MNYRKLRKNEIVRKNDLHRLKDDEDDEWMLVDGSIGDKVSKWPSLEFYRKLKRKRK